MRFKASISNSTSVDNSLRSLWSRARLAQMSQQDHLLKVNRLKHSKSLRLPNLLWTPTMFQYILWSINQMLTTSHPSHQIPPTSLHHPPMYKISHFQLPKLQISHALLEVISYTRMFSPMPTALHYLLLSQYLDLCRLHLRLEIYPSTSISHNRKQARLSLLQGNFQPMYQLQSTLSSTRPLHHL